MINLKLKVATVTLALFLLMSSCVLALDQKYEDFVLAFVDSVKSENKQEILNFIRFPLKRHYPLPSIKTSQEFLLRFDEVFDTKFIEIISNSTLDDWSDVGYRGIMLDNGIMWLNYDGTILGINYQSDVEKQKQLKLINSERETLYAELRNYLEPVLEWETENFIIRIDHLGDYEYRYASWSADKKTSEKPDLILNQGVLIPDGSGGNRYFEFCNGEYKYICYIWVIGTSKTPPGELYVYKNDHLLLRESVIEREN